MLIVFEALSVIFLLLMQLFTLIVQDKTKSISNLFSNVFFSFYSALFFFYHLLYRWDPGDTIKSGELEMFIHPCNYLTAFCICYVKTKPWNVWKARQNPQETHISQHLLVKNHSFSAMLKGHWLENSFLKICTDEISFIASTHWNRLCVCWTILDSLFCQASAAYLHAI